MLVPLYGFLKGDVIGLVVLVQDDQPVGDIATSLQQAATSRVAPAARASVWHNGRKLDATLKVRDAGLQPLDRVDVVQEPAPDDPLRGQA